MKLHNTTLNWLFGTQSYIIELLLNLFVQYFLQPHKRQEKNQ